MAGAVSAGAYTAGVMDYLIEALDAWEVARGQEGIPRHRVVIPAMGGASAGGMTGLMTASVLNRTFEPIRRAPTPLLQEVSENTFYHSWVDLTAREMMPALLDTSDIKKEKILSLLNANFVEQIATRVMQASRQAWLQRAYIPGGLKVFVTLSNLRGYWFDIFFRAHAPQPQSYYSVRHHDYACFSLNGTDSAQEGWMPLNFQTGESIDIVRDAAMATGAFPVGLSARLLTREARYINNNPWLRETLRANPLPEGNFTTLNIDGGMINNEPFEKVRDILNEVTGQSSPEDYNHYDRFKSTVLMIDPFPSTEPEYNEKPWLGDVALSTLGALINQARIKPETLINALQSNCAGQYLIAPTRKVPGPNGLVAQTGSKAIACGAFSGFAGFVNKEFRIHDFFLGRANCEKFLRDHFTVPESSRNAVTEGYAHLSTQQRQRFYSITDAAPGLPIIPVLTPRASKYLPVFSSGSDWPSLSAKSLVRLEAPLKRRVEALMMNLADYNTFTYLALLAGSRIVLRRKIAQSVLGALTDSLREHALIAG